MGDEKDDDCVLVVSVSEKAYNVFKVVKVFIIMKDIKDSFESIYEERIML